MSRFDRLLLGVAFLILTVMMAWATEGDVTIAVLTIPIAMYLIFGKEYIDHDLEEIEQTDEIFDGYLDRKEPQLFDLREDDAA